MMHLSRLGMTLKIPSRLKSGCCTRNHSRTAVSTFSLSRNRRPPQVLLQRSGQMEDRRDKVRTNGLRDMTVSWAICCVLHLPSATTFRKTKCLINTQVTGWGTVLTEHASCTLHTKHAKYQRLRCTFPMKVSISRKIMSSAICVPP
jgi:hypothetical protein